MQAWTAHTLEVLNGERRTRPSMFSIDLPRRSPSPFRSFSSRLQEVRYHPSRCEAVDGQPDRDLRARQAPASSSSPSEAAWKRAFKDVRFATAVDCLCYNP